MTNKIKFYRFFSKVSALKSSFSDFKKISNENFVLPDKFFLLSLFLMYFENTNFELKNSMLFLTSSRKVLEL